jgi:hypothetical protein
VTFAVNVLGWVGVVGRLVEYWLDSTQKATGDCRTSRGMDLLGAVLVLVNPSFYEAYPSVGVNAARIAIGAYTLASHIPNARGRHVDADDEPGQRLISAGASFSQAPAFLGEEPPNAHD